MKRLKNTGHLREMRMIVIAVIFAVTFTAGGVMTAFGAQKPVTGDAYTEKSFTDLYDAKKLSFEGGMRNLKVEKLAEKGGILLSGTAEDFKTGNLKINGEFNFNEDAVGRVSIDALSSKSIDTVLSVCLDDKDKPLAEFGVRYQMGKVEWTNDGNKSKEVIDKAIKGKHTVSVKIDVPDEKKTKKVKVFLRSIEFAECSLPLMVFDLDESKGSVSAMNSSEDHSIECYGKVSIKTPEGYVSEYTGKAPEEMKKLKLEYIRGRGNSTWTEAKKPYKVKFDKKQDLFGMGENKHWILLANRLDPSLVRNRLTYWIGKELGMEFTPKCVPVEVVVNDDYYGSYLLCEQIRVGASRVDIDDLEDDVNKDVTTPPEVTGGYLLSMESGEETDPRTVNTKGAWFYLESPSFEDYKNDAQRNYIKDYLQKTEDAIFGKGFKDSSGKSYKEYLDVPSAVDYWWMQGFTLNGDAYSSNSTYLYKKRNGKLYWGPLWDFDYVAWGDLEYGEPEVQGFPITMDWFERLRQSIWFSNRLIKRWPKLKSILDEAVKKGGKLDQYYDELKVSAQYDNSRWGDLDERGFDLEEGAGSTDFPDSYAGEMEQLRNWIKARISWVDDNIDELKVRKYKIRFYVKKKVKKKQVRKLVETKVVRSGETIDKIPKAPKKKGYIFKGWYAKDYGYLSAGDMMGASERFTAKYVKRSKAKKAKYLFFGNYDVYIYGVDSEYTYLPTYSVKPAGSIYKIKWSSSDKSVASVASDGTVTPKKPGTVKITGKIKGCRKKTYKLHILDYENMEDGEEFGTELKVNKKKIKLRKGQYKQYKVKTWPKPCMNGEIRYMTMNRKIAAVDENGVIKGKKKGVTYIVAYDSETDILKKLKVVVKGKKKKRK